MMPAMGRNKNETNKNNKVQPKHARGNIPSLSEDVPAVISPTGSPRQWGKEHTGRDRKNGPINIHSRRPAAYHNNMSMPTLLLV